MRLDFSGRPILVIGDCMLDRYYFGSVGRISPEAPVPVVKIAETRDTLGGAGNVANNCAHLGAAVTLIGALGNDEYGAVFKRLCGRNHIALAPIASGGGTIAKTRVIGGHQQIVRLDFEEEAPALARGVAATVRKKSLECLKSAGAVVLSDYGKGICSAEVCAEIIREARRRAIPVIVDPKGSSWDKYRGASVVTPNVQELGESVGATVPNEDAAIATYAGKIRRRFSLEALLVTRSEKGMTLVEKKSVSHVPTQAREVFDVSGAGDTVVATLAAGLANGYSLGESVAIANKAAGIVVAKIGTVPVELVELRAEIDKNYNAKLLSLLELVRRCADERKRGRTVVFTNGCFDILHRGHVHLFREAKKYGDILVVALNSDRSIATVRGPDFPLNPESDRAHLIAAIDGVDYITLFDAPTPLNLLRRIRPDVIVKGGNYREQEVVGKEYARKTVIIPQLKGYSTKEIIRKIGGKG
ncbi:MAG: D-glycero-beta-D-manno-heptose-7-phosphate kinase [Chitinispirillaceae bacterium]|jgi:D-beta-D-heptose 7-phosphate kinase/D-beta-D-heptose 1-phosphate adenosyltransferase